MHMLSRLFSSSSTEFPIDWQHVRTGEELNAAFQRSENIPVAFFKHSTRCGVSRMVLNAVLNEWRPSDGKLEFHFLDLLEHRDLSNAIAERTGVRHESPQLIVVHEGRVIHSASHQEISVKRLFEDLGGTSHPE